MLKKADLNHAVKSGAKLALELLLDLNHVDLTATHNHSDQSIVLRPGSLASTHSNTFLTFSS